MDLAELKFVVNTDDLVDAAKKIAELGTQVTKLNKPMQNLSKESAKTNKELSKAEEAAAKAALAQAKLEQAQSKSAQAAAKSSSVLERQNLILEYMAQGNSKGQASILATAKAAGALDDEMLQLNKTLVTQRTLIGGDPFDKSIGLMQKLQNEYKTTTEVTNLFNKNLGLTEKQMTDLAREKQRLIALYGIEGKSLDSLSSEYDQLIQKSAMINKANDARTNSMKAQIKAQNDTAKANEYMAKELERVNRLTESSGNVTSATNNKLIKFEQALKLSGATAAQQVSKLEDYRQKLLSIQKAGGDRQVDYLSRALGPQITDIAVGLATGQAPLTILLQQGGQLRDQFALAGVAGSKMGEMLVKAAGAMVTSVKDVGLAVGQVFVTAIGGAGKSVTNFAMQITGANVLLDAFRVKIIETAGANSIALKAFDMLGKGIIAMTGLLAFGAVAALVAFGVAMSDVIKEENALNRALNLTGAAMGMSLDASYTAAKGMEEFGVSTGTALSVLTEMAKIGGMSADSLNTVATTAKALQTAFNIPIEDTVKKFKELQEKPTESLTKLAVQLGTIPVEILKQVDAYERAGESIKAAELATTAYADAGKDAADRTVQNFGIITRLGISIGEIWDKTWDSIMGIGRMGTLDQQIADAEKEILRLIPKVPEGADVNNFDAQQLEIAESRLRALKDQVISEKNLAAERKANAEEAVKFEKDKKTRDEAANKIKSEAKRLEQSYVSELEKARETYISQSGALDNLTKAEIALNKVRTSPEFNKYTEAQRKNIESLYLAASAIEKANKVEKERSEFLKVVSDLEDKASGFTKQYSDQLNLLTIGLVEGWLNQDEFNIKLQELNKIQPGVIKAHRDHANAIEEFTKAQKKADDALFDSLDVQHQLNMQVLEQNDLLALEGSLIGATDAQRKKALGTKKLDLQLEKEILAIKKSPISASEQESQIARARQRRLDAEKNLNTEIANDFASEMQKQYDVISNSLTDATITALFEGGKAGSKKLRDLIVAELKKPITIVIKAVVDNLFGDLINSATGGKSGSSSGVGSNILSTLKSGYDLITNGVSSAITTSFNKFALSSTGESLGLSSSSNYNPGLTSTGQNIGTALGMAGNAVAGYGLQKSISGGYKTGESGIVDAITVAASAYFGPIAGVVAGVFNRAFGRKLVDSGVKGSFGGAEGFQGENFTFEKGGWFRSDRERGSALDTKTQSAFSMQFKSLQVQNALMADTLGQSTEAIVNFTKDVRLSFQGLTEEQVAEKIQAEFIAINESLADLALGTTEYTRQGETAAQALARLSSSLLTANEAIKHWGVTLYDVSLAGADASSTFIELFGGIENFSRAMGFFYDNFFSETEKIENLTTDLTTAFGKLGLELPSTREAFRALVVAAKEAGDDTQVKNLIDLQYAFAELVPVTEAVSDTVEEITEVMTKNMQDLLKERKNLEVQLLQVQGKTEEANAALRNIATEGFTEAEIAAYDFNQTLEDQIQSYKDAKTAADNYKKITDDLIKEQVNLNIELLKVQGKTSEANAILRALATEGLSEAQIALYDYNESLKDQIQSYVDAKAAAEELVQTTRQATETAFDNLKEFIQESIVVLEQTFTATDLALENVKRAIDAEKDLAQVRLDSALEQEQSVKAVFDVLSSTISGIRGRSNSTGNLSSARSLISDAINTGVLPDADKLSDALATVRDSVESTSYATKVEQVKASLRLANELQVLQDIAEPQLSSAERAVVVAQDQLLILDTQLRKAQLQVDTLREIDNSVLSVDKAIGNLLSATSAEAIAREQINVLNSQLSTSIQQYNELRNLNANITSLAGAISGFQAAVQAEKSAAAALAASSAASTSSGNASTSSAAASIPVASASNNQGLSILSTDSAEVAAAKVLYQSATGGVNSSLYNQYVSGAAGIAAKASFDGDPDNLRRIYGFADGGFYPGGLALVGEEGPELINFNQSGQVYNAGQTASLLGGSSSEELTAIRQELIMLRAEVRADVSHNAKTAKILSRVTPDGETLAVSATIDGGAL